MINQTLYNKNTLKRNIKRAMKINCLLRIKGITQQQIAKEEWRPAAPGPDRKRTACGSLPDPHPAFFCIRQGQGAKKGLPFDEEFIRNYIVAFYDNISTKGQSKLKVEN